MDEWFDLYADDVFRFSLWLTGNRDDALDAVQEVFFRAYPCSVPFHHIANSYHDGRLPTTPRIGGIS